jgi:hypothetical protein
MYARRAVGPVNGSADQPGFDRIIVDAIRPFYGLGF